MRIGKAGLKTAIVPLAQVHHGFAPSARRRDDWVPRDLFEIGASLAVYLCKHDGNLAAFPLERTAQRHRLLSNMVAGRLLPPDVAKILTTLALIGLNAPICVNWCRDGGEALLARAYRFGLCLVGSRRLQTSCRGG